MSNPTDSTPSSAVSEHMNRTVGRRDALRIGGITLSLSAIVAACGDGRGGDTAAGRVGNAPVPTDLPNLDVNDVVLLRTASSLENTAVAVYTTAKELIDFDDASLALIDRLIDNHTATSALMGELTEAAGGTKWDSTNPWIMDRSIAPILESIGSSDNPARDVTNLAITLEDIAASTHQTLASAMSTSELRVAVATAAAQESRHSAALVLNAFGTANRVSPSLTGGELTRTSQGTIRKFAISSRFGSVAQQELIVGEPDVNGTRTTYLLATPAENSFIYEELS